MTAERRIVFVVPADFDNPARPSGGNEYDRRLVIGLRDEGWVVDVRPIERPDGVTHALADLRDGSVVLVDGLLAAQVARVWVAQALRLRIAVLMHMSMAAPPPGHGWRAAAAEERAVLDVATAVIATSDWLRHELVVRQCIDPKRISVASPGVDPAPITVPSQLGNRLLCVAPVAPHKGHDVLVGALAQLSELSWTCTCVGSLDRDAGFAAAVRADANRHGIGEQVRFAGVRTRCQLADDYAASDLLVLPSRSEAYGMVVAEALARGLPVVASDVGGVAEAATGRPSGSVRFPGATVPPDDPDALAEQLRTWLTAAGVRALWRQRAAKRRLLGQGWEVTARRVADAIERASAVRVP